MDQPQSIVTFERCYLGALALGAVSTALQWPMLTERLATTPDSAVLGPWFLPVTIAVSWAVSLLLWYFVARRGSNVARWIVTIFFAIGIPALVISFTTDEFPEGLSGVLTVVVFVLQAVAVWMLFRADAKPWFVKRIANLDDTFR